MKGAGPSLQEAFLQAGITQFPAESIERFQTYLELLQRWNAAVNLTSIRDPQAIVTRHFLESAFAAQHLPAGVRTLLDFGSGAGFPGIPIALCRPEILVTLAEARGKKAAFLREAVRVLQLSSTVYQGRVEMLPKGRPFDAVTMRAVDKMMEMMPEAAARAKQYLLLFTTEVALERVSPEFRWRSPILLPESSRSALWIAERLNLLD